MCELTLGPFSRLGRNRPSDIKSASGRRASGKGFASITTDECSSLSDTNGRIVRNDKTGSIPEELLQILDRLGVKPAAWSITMTGFRKRFGHSVGNEQTVAARASHAGRRWFRSKRSGAHPSGDAAIRRLIADCELNARKIVIYGLDKDWKTLPVLYDGTRFRDGSLNIERVGIAPRQADLVVMIQTRNPPSRDKFSFYVRLVFLGQGLQDVQLGLSGSSPQSVKVYDEANGYKVLKEASLDGVVVKVRDVVEVQIPYAALRSALPKPMGDMLSGERARPYVRVELFSCDRANRSVADYGPSVASYRFLRDEYLLDAEAPSDIRRAMPIGSL